MLVATHVVPGAAMSHGAARRATSTETAARSTISTAMTDDDPSAIKNAADHVAPCRPARSGSHNSIGASGGCPFTCTGYLNNEWLNVRTNSRKSWLMARSALRYSFGALTCAPNTRQPSDDASMTAQPADTTHVTGSNKRHGSETSDGKPATRTAATTTAGQSCQVSRRRTP